MNYSKCAHKTIIAGGILPSLCYRRPIIAVPSRTSALDPLCFSAQSASPVLPDPVVILQCEGMLLPVACDAGITDASTILSNNEGVL